MPFLSIRVRIASFCRRSLGLIACFCLNFYWRRNGIFCACSIRNQGGFMKILFGRKKFLPVFIAGLVVFAFIVSSDAMAGTKGPNESCSENEECKSNICKLGICHINPSGGTSVKAGVTKVPKSVPAAPVTEDDGSQIAIGAVSGTLYKDKDGKYFLLIPLRNDGGSLSIGDGEDPITAIHKIEAGDKPAAESGAVKISPPYPYEGMGPRPSTYDGKLAK